MEGGREGGGSDFTVMSYVCSLPHNYTCVCVHAQERQREMTLQRRRSRLKLEASAAGGVPATPTGRNSMEFPENAEFDELISSLKTGDYFSRRRSRGGGVSLTTSRNSTSAISRRGRLEYSRERPASAIELITMQEEGT